MAKDPAFLFYHHDFLVGIAFMSMADRGAYITLLCYLADKGTLTTEQVKQIVGPDISTTLASKFKKDRRGNWYNQRLLEEVDKRKAFCDSRRKSRMTHVRGINVQRTGNVNENRNENISRIKKTIAFVPPIIEDVKKYCDERNNGIDSQAFIDFYQARGWKFKTGQPVKDWKACIRTWEARNKLPIGHGQITKRPIEMVVLEKIAAKLTDREIMQDLAGKYTEHDIIETVSKCRKKQQ